MYLLPKTDKKMKEDLYIRVLLFANEKQETGFTWEEIKNHFDLTPLQESWIRKIFLTASDKDRKFFEHLRNDESTTPNQHYYSLNEKGISAAINYKGLTHAEANSGHALWFAGLSILLTGIGIFLQLKQTTLTEIQTAPEQIRQARIKQNAIDFCKGNPNSVSSGLYYPSSSKELSCSEALLLDK
ncbi:MAG: hypothetical protein AAB767_02295 [Patescibacteria group bacterium]